MNDEMTDQERELYNRAADIIAIKQNECLANRWVRDAREQLDSLRARGIFLTTDAPAPRIGGQPAEEEQG